VSAPTSLLRERLVPIVDDGHEHEEDQTPSDLFRPHSRYRLSSQEIRGFESYLLSRSSSPIEA
jgi:hypothetical protein